MKSILFSLSCLLSAFVYSQTADDIRYLNIEKAESSPDSIQYLFLDCNTDNCNKLFNEFGLYKNLKGLYISNYNGKTVGNGIKELDLLETLTIEKSPEINLSRLFSDISSSANLKSISLKDNDLTRLPSNVKNLVNLKSINIANNNNLNLEKTIDQLAMLKKLEDIYLPVNSITDLPDNISQLKQLKTLDISNNYLEDLPDGIGELRSLEQLYLEGNLIQDITSTLENVQNINLKYIALDEGLSDEDKVRLKELFPNTVIKEVDIDESLDAQIENNLIDENNAENLSDTSASLNKPPTVSIIETPEKETIDKTATPDITYGELTIEENGLKLYSQAYIHYADVFKIQRFSVFDSTMFEERFTDTTYANVTKIVQYQDRNIRDYERLVLLKLKHTPKGDTWFKISAWSSSYINQNNTELNAFIGMSWVYAGPLTPKEFKKKYQRVEGYKWSSPRFWNQRKWKRWSDIRVTYNNEAQNFTLKIKDLDGFTEIIAYPRYNSLNRSLDDAQKTYVKRYARYSKALDRRKRRFERRHQRNKDLHRRSIIDAENKRWKSFQKHHMSADEKKLSKADWLVYYDKVIANERKAMGNANATINNITRSLDLDGYTKGYLWTDAAESIVNNTNTPILQSIRTLYQDKDSNMVAVKKILIIDKDTKSYQTFEGSLGIKMIRLNLVEGANAVFITQLRNDDTGYIKSSVYQKIKFPQNRKYKFTLNTINTKFGSVQMIREELAF